MPDVGRRIKYLIYLLILIFWIILTPDTACANLRAHLNYAIFNSPDKGPYIETYLAIDGTSVNFCENEAGKFQATIEITYIFKYLGEVFEFDKYQLRSNEVTDTTSSIVDLLDQQRYFIPSGEYEFEIKLQDLNSKAEPINSAHLVKIDFDGEKIGFSAMQLVDSLHKTITPGILTKSGFDMYPKVLNYYPEYMNSIKFYTEVYNSIRELGEGEKFLIKSYIKTFESDFVLNDYVAYSRKETNSVVPYFKEFDISNLPTGNYILGVELRDKQNNLLTLNALFFRRDNPDVTFQVDQIDAFSVENTYAEAFTDQDSLNESVRCLEPRATNLERQFIFKELKSATMEEKQKFHYYFWSIRNPENPEEAWLVYLEMVKIVNEKYSTPVQKGYETDRGRTYLKYGPPNIITESYHEPSSYPYEIWQYYKLGNNQTNKKFVFYTHDLTTNDFILLHSNAIGEVYNHRWQIVLNSRWFDPYSPDISRPPDIWGSKAEEYYRNPY